MWPRPYLRRDGDVLRLEPLRALDEIELDARAFRKAAESLRLNRAEMDEDVLSAGRGDESETLRVVEPLDSTGATHAELLLISVGLLVFPNQRVLLTYNFRDSHRSSPVSLPNPTGGSMRRLLPATLTFG